MELIAKSLILFGIILITMGLILNLNFPLLGKLPGDIAIKKKNFSFYFPLTTSIIISIILTIIFWIISKIRG